MPRSWSAHPRAARLAFLRIAAVVVFSLAQGALGNCADLQYLEEKSQELINKLNAIESQVATLKFRDPAGPLVMGELRPALEFIFSLSPELRREIVKKIFPSESGVAAGDFLGMAPDSSAIQVINEANKHVLLPQVRRVALEYLAAAKVKTPDRLSPRDFPAKVKDYFSARLEPLTPEMLSGIKPGSEMWTVIREAVESMQLKSDRERSDFIYESFVNTREGAGRVDPAEKAFASNLLNEASKYPGTAYRPGVIAGIVSALKRIHGVGTNTSTLE